MLRVLSMLLFFSGRKNIFFDYAVINIFVLIFIGCGCFFTYVGVWSVNWRYNETAQYILLAIIYFILSNYSYVFDEFSPFWSSLLTSVNHNKSSL